MKTKLRRLVSILLAMVLMVCCAVPAFADDISTRLNDNNIADILQKNYKTILSNRGYTDDYAIACYWYSGDYGDRGILYGYQFYLIDKSYIGKTISDDSVDFISAFSCDHLDTKSKLLSNTSGITISGGKFLSRLRYDISHIPEKHFVFSNFSVENIFDGKDPNAPVVPFSVQYSRKLTTGMSRSGTLSAPGAKNDGETITNNNIDVTVKLTDEYKQAMQKALDKDPKATQYTYQYVLFITPYDPNIFGTKKAMDGAIYTFLDKSKYVLSTAYGKTKSNTTTDSKYDTVSTPDSSSTDTSSSNVGEMTSENADGVANSAFCNGVTPLFGLPIANGANMTNTHTINLENIKGADKLGEQDILYIVVVGKRYLYETGAEGYSKDFYANNAEFKTFYKELPDNAVASKINGLYGGNGYDFYTVVSDGFSFKDYPDYKPLEINGVEYPTDKPISDMLDDPFPPSKITDYDGLENGTDFDTKEDFDEYIRNKTYDEKFGSFSFDLSDISSIFDSTSDFFKFMTASIGLMPSIFITVLIAFFTIMLAICVVKWAIK